MKMTPREYQQYVKKMSPKSPLLTDCIKAFLIGGAICAIGQLIMNGYITLGLGKTDAGTCTSITLVFIGALLTGLHLYDKLAKHAGAGTIVPITGFANAIVSPAIEYKSEGLILGLGAKLFVIAGPVLVYGITASVLYGLVLLVLKGGGAG